MKKNIRKIIHVDMDAFYASVEQLDDSNLKGKAIAVGGESKRGVVAAASYEARKFGVRSAMSSVIAKNICKNLIFVKPRFHRYKEISKQIRSIFFEYTDLVEPLSLDEAFLDVTENKKNINLASTVAKEIRTKIKRKIGLNSSAGISINKFIAKVATEINKPNGQKTIHPSQVDSFIDSLEIGKFFGVGKVTAKKMNSIGVFTGKDLRRFDQVDLLKHFGKSGKHYFEIVRSIQDNPVNPNRERKSVGAEQTFSNDLDSENFILEKLKQISEDLENRMKKNSNKGKTITVKIKYDDFTQETRSKTIDRYISKKEDFFPIIEQLIFHKSIDKSVRLLGISITNLYKKDVLAIKDYNLQLKLDF